MLRTPDYGRLFFFETPSGTEAGGGNPPAATPPTVTPPSTEGSGPVTFTAEQQAEINRLIGNARKEGRTAAEHAAIQAEQERQAEAERERLEKAGEFETVKQTLLSERDAVKTEAADLKAQNVAYAAIVAEQVDALKKDLPAELLGEFPNEGSALDQLTWLKDRKQLFEVAKTAAGVAPATVTRLPKTPSSSGTGAKTVEQMSTEMRSRISI